MHGVVRRGTEARWELNLPDRPGSPIQKFKLKQFYSNIDLLIIFAAPIPHVIKCSGWLMNFKELLQNSNVFLQILFGR